MTQGCENPLVVQWHRQIFTFYVTEWNQEFVRKSSVGHKNIKVLRRNGEIIFLFIIFFYNLTRTYFNAIAFAIYKFTNFAILVQEPLITIIIVNFKIFKYNLLENVTVNYLALFF